MSARQLLQAAGWTAGRRVPVDPAIAGLRQAGYETWRELEVLLAEFCFLVVHDARRTKSVWIDPRQAVGKVDPAWMEDYKHLCGSDLVPVGGYSHMTLMFGRDSVIYGGFDREFGPLGTSMEEMVQGLLCTFPPVRLSMTFE